VVGDEGFRTPHWSAVLLHLHFSVAGGDELMGKTGGSGMTNEQECHVQVEGHQGNRVSSAVWPVNVRKVVATGKAAQRRRDWIMQGRWLLLLADALAVRLLFLLAMGLVVATSLLVAIMGLRFWYLWLLPLALLLGLLLRPMLLARRRTPEMLPPPMSSLSGEFRSSTGMLSLYAQGLKSQPGVFAFKSQPGTFSPRSELGLLTHEPPATPMPEDPPLVRVLETYDLRSLPVEHFLQVLPTEATDKHEQVHLSHKEDDQKEEQKQLDEK
jgi:hypothetical protein